MQARLQQINEEWKRLEEARERRERLDRRIDDLRAQRRERKEKEQECAGILAKERADVEALTHWLDWAFNEAKSALPKAA